MTDMRGSYVKWFACLVLLAGCSMEGKLAEKDLNKVMACKDLRDGETWEFNTNTVKNIRAGFAGGATSATLTDSNGRDRTITSDMNAYIKCQPKS